MRLETIEQVFLSLINGYTPPDLEYAIKEGIDLSEFLNNPLNMIIYRPMAKPFESQKHELTTDIVLKVLEDQRPDLYGVVRDNPKAEKWLEVNLERIVKKLF